MIGFCIIMSKARTVNVFWSLNGSGEQVGFSRHVVIVLFLKMVLRCNTYFEAVTMSCEKGE